MTEANLVRSVADGDADALEDLIALYDTDMLRVAVVICRDADLAEDAVQQAWRIAWRRLRSLHDPSRVKSWLVAVAANEARQITRAEGRRRRREAERRVAPPRDHLTDITDRVYLDAVLARLTPDDRELLALRYVAGLNSTEIARLRRSTSAAVRGRLSRLLTDLREELDHE